MAKSGAAVKKGGTPRKRKPSRSKAAKAAAGGKQTPAAENVNRAVRDIEIFDEWRGEKDVTTIAAKHDLSPSRVQEVIDEMRNGQLATLDLKSKVGALQYTEDMLLRMEYAVTQAAGLIEKAIDDKNWSAALGGMKRVADARRELTEVRKERGLLPRNLGLLTWTAESIRMAERVLDLFERHGIPEDVQAEFIDAIGWDVRAPGGPRELNAGDAWEAEGEVTDAQVVG